MGRARRRAQGQGAGCAGEKGELPLARRGSETLVSSGFSMQPCRAGAGTERGRAGGLGLGGMRGRRHRDKEG